MTSLIVLYDDRMNLELRHLRALVAVADAGTFTDAAISLGTSQASISRSVAALESALGVRVFQRTTRSVTPTAAGKRIIEHARRVLDEAVLLEEAARDHAGELRVGYAWSALGSRTIALQRRWEDTNPGVQLIWVQSGSLSAGLAGGSVDLAVVRRQLNDKRFTETLIGTERRYAAVAATDPLARRRFLRMADFAGRTIAVDSRTGTTAGDLWGSGCPAGLPAPRAGRGRLADADLHRQGHGHVLRSDRNAVPTTRGGLQAGPRRAPDIGLSCSVER